MIAFLLAFAAPLPPSIHAQQAETAFICPELLPDEASRKAAMELFVRLAMASGADTPAKIAELRTRLLARHHCEAPRRR